MNVWYARAQALMMSVRNACVKAPIVLHKAYRGKGNSELCIRYPDLLGLTAEAANDWELGPIYWIRIGYIVHSWITKLKHGGWRKPAFRKMEPLTFQRAKKNDWSMRSIAQWHLQYWCADWLDTLLFVGTDLEIYVDFAMRFFQPVSMGR